jgi:hypothetical protein
MVKAVAASSKKVVKAAKTPKTKSASSKKLSTKSIASASGAATKKAGKKSEGQVPPAVVALLEANPFCSIILVEDEEGKKSAKPLLLIVKVRDCDCGHMLRSVTVFFRLTITNAVCVPKLTLFPSSHYSLILIFYRISVRKTVAGQHLMMVT